MNELMRRILFLPEQASTFSKDVDQLHYYVIGTTMVVSTAIGLSALLLFVRYRRRSKTQQTVHTRPTLFIELCFIGIPLAFFLTWFAIGYRDFVKLNSPPPDAMDVYVMGKQWMWKFSYPDGPSSVGVLRVPRGRPVRLLLTSRDVIHSFFVPEFRIKMDVLPGRYTQSWFEATHAGTFQVLCAEYCGTSHSMMRGQVVVMEPDEFDQWMEDQRRGLVAKQDGSGETTLVAQGQRLSQQLGCTRCHSTDGTRHIGPTWADLFGREERLESGDRVRVDEAYLTESMMDPHAKVVAGYRPVMPSFQGRLAGGDVAALIEFIKSLRSPAGPTQESEGPVYEPVGR
jgi:cytochrome c oxidase subunit 2